MTLIVKPAARRDILQQYSHYLTLDLPEVADRFLVSVEAAIEAIAATPRAGGPRRFDNPSLQGLRAWPLKGFDEFRVYYLEQSERLVIVRVLHGRRDVSSLLEGERNVDDVS